MDDGKGDHEGRFLPPQQARGHEDEDGGLIVRDDGQGEHGGV